MENHKFITARFVDNNKTIVEIEWMNEDKKSVNEIVEANEGIAWVNLLTHISLDDIHENTSLWIREQRKLFEGIVKRLSKKDFQPAETNKFPGVVTTIFRNTANADDLFALKLALFELDSIRGSENSATKSKLRKSKNMFDVLRFAFDIADEEELKTPTVVVPKKKPSKK